MLDRVALPMHLRSASRDDADAVASVLAAAFREFEPLYTPAGFRATTLSAEEIADRLGEGPTWVVVDGDRIVGTVSAVVRAGEVYVRSMAVLPIARGKGTATRLLEAVHAYAAGRGACRLLLTTTPFLHDAIRLYEHHGFTRSPESMDLHGTPLLAMVKDLHW
jgi:GNAT superfamily N-acetyltransferase